MKTHDNYYDTVSDSLLKRLTDFRQDVPLHALGIGKHHWTYYAQGNSEHEALLLLSGGGGDAEAMFTYIERFSRHFRVIAPNLPASLMNLDDATNGLDALLTHEGISEIILVGISFGAILAQLYIRRFQDTVTDLIICHSLIPSKHLAEPARMQQLFMHLYPASLLMWLSKRAYHKHIANSITPVSDETKRFWQAYFDETYSRRLGKQHLLSRARLTTQYHSEHEFNSRDLLQWQGELLIIESEEDDVISDGDRGSLKAMYTRAYIQTLYGYDHLAPLLASDELIGSITNFLLKEE